MFFIFLLFLVIMRVLATNYVKNHITILAKFTSKKSHILILHNLMEYSVSTFRRRGEGKLCVSIITIIYYNRDTDAHLKKLKTKINIFVQRMTIMYPNIVDTQDIVYFSIFLHIAMFSCSNSFVLNSL